MVTASNNGAENNPGWFHNLMVHPQTTIEVDGTTKSVMAHQASAEEKGRLWPEWTEKAPFFEGYRKRTSREIPMVIFQPSDAPA